MVCVCVFVQVSAGCDGPFYVMCNPKMCYNQDDEE